MSKYSALVKRASNATAAMALTLASLTPAVMIGGSAKAGQMTERQILMTNSNLNTASTYTVSFKPTATTTIKRIVVDFCEGSPIINQDCSNEMDTMVTPTTGSSSVLLNGGSGVSFDITGTSSGSNEVILSNATGRTVAAANSDVVSFAFNVTNEQVDAGTFYARVVTYGSESASYTDNSVGAYIDAGGIALSTTNDVTINARVQEQLKFCVGATADYQLVSDDCTTNWDGSTIDLGVLDNISTSTTPNTSSRDGNSREGAFLVSTNAINGVKIYYTSPNSLRVGNTACENANTNATDQCINADASTAAFSSTGTEKFGMSLTNIADNDSPAGEGTMTAQNGYDTGYAWNTTSQVEIASTDTVISQEVGQLTFKGNAAVTTPSGYYTTSANFVAVASF